MTKIRVQFDRSWIEWADNTSNRLIKPSNIERKLAPFLNNPLMTDRLVYCCFYSQQPSLGRSPFCKSMPFSWRVVCYINLMSYRQSSHSSGLHDYWLWGEALLIHFRTNLLSGDFPLHMLQRCPAGRISYGNQPWASTDKCIEKCRCSMLML